MLAEGGFNLRKFISNFQSLQERIEANEGFSSIKEQKGCSVVEEDKTYTKDVLGEAKLVRMENRRYLE